MTSSGANIANAAIKIVNVMSGPWKGSMESKTADQIPREYAVGATSTNMLYLPRTGTWKRRGGQAQVFDTFGAAVGALPAIWLSSATSAYAKARQMEEFLSPAVTDNVPTVCALVSKETISSGLDDGWFAQFWWRDQVAAANRTLGSEFSGTTYPTLGSLQNFKVIPLWYESGDGGLTRGTTEFLRRFFMSGSRRFLKVGNWWYFPSLKGTPCRWNGGMATATTGISRLIPSGPLPPTHAGSLGYGSVAVPEALAQTGRPDADISAGTFTPTGSATLFGAIDESIADDADYIDSAAGSVTSCDISLSTLGVTPGDDAIVKIVVRARRVISSTYAGVFSVYLLDGATIRATRTELAVNNDIQTFSLQLSIAEMQAITANGGWTNLTLRLAVERTSSGAITSNYFVRVTYAALIYSPSSALATGSWFGKDRFFYSVAYRFEDGSVWAPCAPRFPNATLPDGFNMFTVNKASPTSQYDFIIWSNIPIGPQGVVSRILLRTPKVDSTIVGDDLKLNPYDLRIVDELTDNSTTTYKDSQADDFGLAEDSSGAFIRYDHIMPPRSRYIAGGDMRIIHAYGGRNPCAIEIAPVGREADNDLNLADTNSTAFTSNGSYMRVRYQGATPFLDLIQSDASAATNTINIDLLTDDTLQKLVDRINKTTFAVNGQQWRAQLCPGANPSAPSATCLTPHYRTLTSACTTVSGTPALTRGAGGLSVIAVGTILAGTSIPSGTYVIRIVSDSELTMSANATSSASPSVIFYTNMTDIAVAGVESALSYQRVISNALPGFLYFNSSYLNVDAVDKSSVWMTVGTPGSIKSSPNSFSGKVSNRFKPPTNAGISMGGAAVDSGFVLPFSSGVYALKNTQDQNVGLDENYKLAELNAVRGCIAWNTVTPGNRFVPYLTAEGLCCADLEREFLMSEALWLHAPLATGSMSYEIPLCVSATAKDDDTAYASARVMRSAIWLNYRTSTSTTHPNRQAMFDFSSGHVSNGLEALFRAPGDPWGWSTPLVRSVTAMCEGRRSDGGHIYGWNDANAASTGDGRIDEFETTDTDNGTAISAGVIFPWQKLGKHYKLSAQEIILDHAAPAGATIFLDFHRSYSDETYTLTPSTTALVVGHEVKFLPQAARVVTAACYIGYRQTAGAAAELREFVLRLKPVPLYTGTENTLGYGDDYGDLYGDR